MKAMHEGRKERKWKKEERKKKWNKKKNKGTRK